MSDCDDKFQLDKDSAETALNSHPAESASINTPRLNTLLDSQGRPVDENEEDAAPILETPQDRRMRKRSHYIVYLTCFIVSLGFSIVLTGVWPYMKKLDHGASKEFLGWVIAANPFGQMLASPLLGLWANKLGSNRWPFIVTIIFFIFGNILYGILPLTKPYSDYFLLLSRFIVGLSSGNIAICRSYIVSASKFRERTAALSFVAAAQSLGFILGPSIQAGTASIYKAHNETDLMQEDSISIDNMYSSVAWMAAVLGALNLVLFLPFFFKEYNVSTIGAAHKSSGCEANSNHRQNYLPIFVIIVAFFTVQTCVALLETILVPMAMDLYAWSANDAVYIVGIGLGSLAILIFIGFGLTAVLSKYIDERKLFLFLGFFPVTLGLFSLFPMGNNYAKIQECFSHSDISNSTELCISNCSSVIEVHRPFLHLNTIDQDVHCTPGCPSHQKWCFDVPIIEISQLWAGLAIVFLGYAFASTLSMSLMSKMIGNRPQGLWMGILSASGALARISGPIVVTFIYYNFGTRWMVGTFGVLTLSMTFVCLLFYKRFVPLHSHSNAETVSA